MGDHRAERGILVAQNNQGVIGRNGVLPWHYPADLKRFKRLTVGTTVIMGRLTWESLPRKPLPDRANIVVTSRPEWVAGDAATAGSLGEAVAAVEGDLWFIGGARIYAAAMSVATRIDVTWVPDRVEGPGLVHFPPIDSDRFRAKERTQHPDDPALEHQIFVLREC